MKNRYSLGKIFLSLFIFGALSGCTHHDNDGNLAVFHTYEKDDVKTWDPANAYDMVSLDVMPMVMETPYQYTYLSETFKVEPLLADGMPKYSADHLTVTIKFKKGVKFQDDPCFKATAGKGREFKAQDMIYGFKRLALPSLDSQGWWILDGKVKGINEFHDKLGKADKKDLEKIMDEEVEGLKALDDYTIQIKLLKPYPQLQYALAMGFASPVAREAVAAYADEKGNLTNNPVGTGPFIMKRWDHNRKVVLEKNPNFRTELYPSKADPEFVKRGMLADAGKPLPFVDRIDIDIIKEDQPRWLSFLDGKQDTITIPKDNISQALTNGSNLAPDLVKKGVRLQIETGIAFYYVSFNQKDKLIGGNKLLRQALSAAIDRDKWIEFIRAGLAKKQVTALPPGIADRASTKKIKYDFNLEQAKELLKKAGYPDGQGLPPIKFDLRGASTTDRQLGDFMTQQWNRIGVKVDVIENTFPAYLEKQKQGNLQTSLGGWVMDYPDAENVYQLLYGPNQAPGPGEANYNNPEFNKLYEQMAVMESSPKRAAIVQKMDDLLQEDVPWALGFYDTTFTISNAWLMNFRASDMVLNKYKYVRIDKEIKKRYLEGK